MSVETRKITKVLVANRGEIAVRVIRAARDAGIASVAVYAEPDADAPFVSMADEAFALGGQNSAESYLVIDKIIDAAKKSGANAIHPGYGFLSENAEFAQAVIDADLIWIGPSPESIRDLGDKVTARHIALRANAPMAPGTKEPVKDAAEVVAFAEEHGLPIAIKAAFMPRPPPPKAALMATGSPCSVAKAVTSAASATGSAVPGTSGALARVAMWRALTLSPRPSMASGPGPIHVRPASMTAWAKWAFSARKP